MHIASKFLIIKGDIVIMKQLIVCVILIIVVGIAQAGQDITGEYQWNKGKKVIRTLTITKLQGDTYHFEFYAIEDHGVRSREGGEEFDSVIKNGQVRYNQEPDEFGMHGCNIVITFSKDIADVKGDCTTDGFMTLAGMKYKKLKTKSK